jgi:hypothetical protein
MYFEKRLSAFQPVDSKKQTCARKQPIGRSIPKHRRGKHFIASLFPSRILRKFYHTLCGIMQFSSREMWWCRREKKIFAKFICEMTEFLKAIKSLHESELYDDLIFFVSLQLPDIQVENELDTLDEALLWKLIGDAHLHTDSFFQAVVVSWF